jgi:hypothetical protein
LFEKYEDGIYPCSQVFAVKKQAFRMTEESEKAGGTYLWTWLG